MEKITKLKEGKSLYCKATGLTYRMEDGKLMKHNKHGILTETKLTIDSIENNLELFEVSSN